MQQHDTFESRESFETETDIDSVLVKAVKQEHPSKRHEKLSSSFRYRYRDGIVCELCERQGYKAIEDGCTDAAEFLRISNNFLPPFITRQNVEIQI